MIVPTVGTGAADLWDIALARGNGVQFNAKKGNLTADHAGFFPVPKKKDFSTARDNPLLTDEMADALKDESSDFDDTNTGDN